MKRKTYVKLMLEQVIAYNRLVQDQYTDFRLYEYNGIDTLNISNGVPITKDGLFLYIEFNKCPKSELKEHLEKLRDYVVKDIIYG